MEECNLKFDCTAIDASGEDQDEVADEDEDEDGVDEEAWLKTSKDDWIRDGVTSLACDVRLRPSTLDIRPCNDNVMSPKVRFSSDPVSIDIPQISIMWAVRRTSSIALRSRTFSAVTCHASYTEHTISSSSNVNQIQFPKPPCGTRLLNRHYSYPHSQTTLNHHYSSMAGTESSGEKDHDLVDEIHKKNVEDENDDDFISRLKRLVDEDKYRVNTFSRLKLLEDEDNDIFVPIETSQQKRFSSALFKVIRDSQTFLVQKELDIWLEKGENISRSDISVAMLELRRRRMYDKALKLSEWLESRKQLEFTEKDYSSRIDLIAKTHGLNAAEIYIETIPGSFKTEMVYQTFLANCVQSAHTTKAEQVINKMKELKFPITSFACNQLLLLYKRTDKKKIAGVQLLMEKENVKPTLFTYLMLVDIKGQHNDINGMEQVVETMKAEGIDPDIKIQAVLARHYIYRGLTEKAKVILQEMEGSDLKKKRHVCSSLLPLYATLQSVVDVDKVWDVCKSNPQLDECLKAMFAYGKLKKVEEAEAVFDQMSMKFKRMSSRHYAEMLKVYANNKMLSKGKNLVEKMEESGCRIGPLGWDALVKLYVESGEIEKAVSVLPDGLGSENNGIKPLFCTYLVIMEQYAKRGDIQNAEKMFLRMRQDGYVRLKQYHCLLQTYKNSNVSVDGFRERMQADNIIPNKALAELLAQVDAFKAVSRC
ncbi:hypothetical protein L1987_21507 [Smallanthus sonchifolius]|uniref:Uncharacterized protein n=1 Tax=Smallanthus sonchifolius TaxID=185202 RepID=A0ACB9IUJ7_9ASTR|nr:hypothetical protein L1987_21507 [Smallanthus sonchifolius]